MQEIPSSDSTVILEHIGTVIGRDFSTSSPEQHQDLLGSSLRSLGFDSLALLELGIQLEDALGLDFNPGEFTLRPESTVAELIETVLHRAKRTTSDS